MSSFASTVIIMFFMSSTKAKEEFCTQQDCPDSAKQTNATRSFLLDKYDAFESHRILLNDYVRVETYFQTILSNMDDFKDKIIMDVGAGTGILSIFAAQAGAKKVYAIEPSDMADHMQTLIEKNGFANQITVIKEAVENINPNDIEKVDTVLSDPFSHMAVHERVLEKVLIARDRFLKPTGKMYPSVVVLYTAPFHDSQLAGVMQTQRQEWQSDDMRNRHGVDCAVLADFALKDNFQHPMIETINPNVLLAKPHKHVWKLKEVAVEEVVDFRIEFSFDIVRNGVMYGLAFWFEVGFLDGSSNSWLSTSPTAQFQTHYKQTRFVFRNGTSIGLNQNQTCIGHVHMKATNERDSYDVTITMSECPATAVSLQPVVSQHSTDVRGAGTDTHLQYYMGLKKHLEDPQLYRTYRQAMLLNSKDIKNKVVGVLDATACVLPVIAAQLGAKKVYASETVFTEACKAVVAASNMTEVVQVFSEPLESHVTEPLDLVISSRHSYLYFHNKKPAQLIAAKKLLKPKGKLFPSEVHLYVTPFSDNLFYYEWQRDWMDIWDKKFFYGLDMTVLKQAVWQQQSTKPIIDSVMPHTFLAQPQSTAFKLMDMDENNMDEIKMNVDFKIKRTALVEGVAMWFDLHFVGSTERVVLSTSPNAEKTSLYQVRVLFNKPMFIEAGKKLNGTVTLKANYRGSYDIVTRLESERGVIEGSHDLSQRMGRNPNQVNANVGFTQTSPTDHFFVDWQPPAFLEQQKLQQQQEQAKARMDRMVQAQEMSVVEYFYNRLQYCYQIAKTKLIGQVSGGSIL